MRIILRQILEHKLWR